MPMARGLRDLTRANHLGIVGPHGGIRILPWDLAAMNYPTK